MLSFFKKNKTKNLRGESYYDRENMVHNINDLLSIFYPEYNNSYSSTKSIQFIGLELSNITKIKLKKILKEPDFIIDGKESFNDHIVLFYRHIVNNLIFIMQFHFLKDNFLFVSNTTSSTTQLTHSEKESFAKLITNKYLPETNINFQNAFEIKITDNHNNYLTIADEIYFTVNYINNTPYNQQLLQNPYLFKELIDNSFESKLDEYF